MNVRAYISFVELLAIEIKRSYNTYDELVTALKVARNLLATYGSGDTVHVCPHTGELLTPAIRQIDVALSNAGRAEK